MENFDDNIDPFKYAKDLVFDIQLAFYGGLALGTIGIAFFAWLIYK